jgi:hypothetical protein
LQIYTPGHGWAYVYNPLAVRETVAWARNRKRISVPAVVLPPDQPLQLSGPMEQGALSSTSPELDLHMDLRACSASDFETQSQNVTDWKLQRQSLHLHKWPAMSRASDAKWPLS